MERHSLSTYLIFLCGGLVAWKVNKQKTISLSSTEAEYVSLSVCAQDVLWLISFLTDIVPQTAIAIPATIFCDNQGAIKLITQPNQTQRLPKHVDVRYLFVRNILKEHKNINIEYLETDSMLADVLTKPLPAPRFLSLRQSFMFPTSTDR